MSYYKKGDFFILIQNLIFNDRYGHERLQVFLNSLLEEFIKYMYFDYVFKKTLFTFKLIN